MQEDCAKALEKVLLRLKEEGRTEEYIESYAMGFRQGFVEAAFDVARKAKYVGIDIEIIMQATGMSRSEVDNL